MNWDDPEGGLGMFLQVALTRIGICVDFRVPKHTLDMSIFD